MSLTKKHQNTWGKTDSTARRNKYILVGESSNKQIRTYSMQVSNTYFRRKWNIKGEFGVLGEGHNSNKEDRWDLTTQVTFEKRNFWSKETAIVQKLVVGTCLANLRPLCMKWNYLNEGQWGQNILLYGTLWEFWLLFWKRWRFWIESWHDAA